MTDTISDEARGLERKLYLIHNGVDNSVEAERIIQSALTAARLKALDELEAAITKASEDAWQNGRDPITTDFIAVIRAMKVQL